jgi:hypothetical protein
MPDSHAPNYTGPERRQPNIVTAQAIQSAVADGIRQAVSDPALWDAAGKAMREQAKSAAGGWLIGGVRAVLTRAAWIVAILAGVYALGGWGAVLAFVKSQGPTP